MELLFLNRRVSGTVAARVFGAGSTAPWTVIALAFAVFSTITTPAQAQTTALYIDGQGLETGSAEA